MISKNECQICTIIILVYEHSVRAQVLYLQRKTKQLYMNTNFTIKNFRVFDENGVTIDIKPMTILTGCNSSGKSSIVKAAFLLNDFMKQVHNAIEKKEKNVVVIHITPL